MYCTHHGTYSRSTTAHSQHISHHVHNSNSKTHTTSLTQPHTNHKYTHKTDGNSGQTHAQPTKPHTTHRECATHTTHSHKHAIEITHRPVCRQHETRHTDTQTKIHAHSRKTSDTTQNQHHAECSKYTDQPTSTLYVTHRKHIDSIHTTQYITQQTTERPDTFHIKQDTGSHRTNTQHVQTPMDSSSEMTKYVTHKEPLSAHNTQLTTTHLTHCMPHRENATRSDVPPTSSKEPIPHIAHTQHTQHGQHT